MRQNCAARIVNDKDRRRKFGAKGRRRFLGQCFERCLKLGIEREVMKTLLRCAVDLGLSSVGGKHWKWPPLARHRFAFGDVVFNETDNAPRKNPRKDVVARCLRRLRKAVWPP